MKFVALLRGINVGGKNIIRMEALRAAFEGLGLTAVATYIQSGNVVFEARRAAKSDLTEQIERALAQAFAYDSKVVLVTGAELTEVVAEAPAGFGSEPERYRYDVVFVKSPLTAHQALPAFEVNPTVDDVHAGTHALYFRRLIALATRSRLSRIVGKPVYKSMTIRNWSTTKRLLVMAEP